MASSSVLSLIPSVTLLGSDPTGPLELVEVVLPPFPCLPFLLFHVLPVGLKVGLNGSTLGLLSATR